MMDKWNAQVTYALHFDTFLVGRKKTQAYNEMEQKDGCVLSGYNYKLHAFGCDSKTQ